MLVRLTYASRASNSVSAELIREVFRKYSSSERFDPFHMSAEQINGLLLELGETLSAIKSPVLS